MHAAQQQFSQVLNESTRAEADSKPCLRQEKGNSSSMFEKLKSGFKGLVTKVTTTELKTENLTPILSEFKMSLAENDVAYPVADKSAMNSQNV